MSSTAQGAEVHAGSHGSRRTLARMRLAPRGAAVAQTTILGFGSLLSEQSSRLTFPDLENFRLVRVPNYRRLM